MPILDVEVIMRPDESIRPGLAKELADRAGEIFESAPGGTWVKVHSMSRDMYAENGGTSEDIAPVFVSVLKAKLPSHDLLQKEVAKLTATIAQQCGCPEENVHIMYLPEGAERVAFGGKVLLG